MTVHRRVIDAFLQSIKEAICMIVSMGLCMSSIHKYP